MRTFTIGSGQPSIAIVGGIHGNEPCGVDAISALRVRRPDVAEPVKCIVANEQALAADDRCLDEDLNRAFPGTPDGETHEQQLATQILEELTGIDLVIDLHSTVAGSEPLVFAQRLDDDIRELARATGIPRFVHIELDGTLIDHVSGIVVECGKKGAPETASTAFDIVLHTLAALGVIDRPYSLADPTVYRVFRKAPKPDDSYEFIAENFSPVAEGEPYAQNSETSIRADKEFVPVLMSGNGYEDIFGYQTEHLGQLSDVDAPTP